MPSGRTACATPRRVAVCGLLALAACAGAPPASSGADPAPSSLAHFEQTPAQAEQAMAAAEAERTNRLQRDLQALAAQPTARGLVVVLPEALFEPGGVALVHEAQPRIAQLAAVLRAHPERRVRIEGVTDDGAAAPSYPRAAALADALVAHGIARERVEVRAHGPRPVAARGADRRIDVVFSDGRGRFAPER